MTFSPQPAANTNRQRSLLAVVMLVLLLACVGGAWWLVQLRTVQPEQIAREILNRIHTQTLNHYWKGKSERLYYLVHDARSQRYWWMAKGRARSEEGYRGWRLDATGFREVWSLNDTATEGVYDGPTSSADPSVTQITLKDQALKVELVVGPTVAARIGSQPVPELYAPEGLEFLLAHLVAEQGKDAAFSILVRDESIATRRVNFAIMKTKPVGRMVEVQVPTPKGLLVRQYVLDETYRVSAILEGNVTYSLTTIEDLLEKFPKDPRLHRLAQQPEPEPEPTTDPAEETQASFLWHGHLAQAAFSCTF